MATEDGEDEDEKLPFKILSWSEKDFKVATCPSVPVKSEIKSNIKQEPEDEMASNLEMSKCNYSCNTILLINI